MRTLPLIAAATALGAIAAPAAAQYYPAPQPTYPAPGQQQPAPYPGQPGYNYPQQGYGYPQQQQGGVADALARLLGNRYAGNDRMAINQCANAAQAQAARQYRPGYNQNRNNQNRYNQGYGYNQQGYARVVAITNVERRNRGLRVTGLMDSGMGGYNQQQYGNYGQNAYAQGDLSFRCNVDNRGAVSNVRISRVDPRRRY